jgi:hypothetical protein
LHWQHGLHGKGNEDLRAAGYGGLRVADDVDLHGDVGAHAPLHDRKHHDDDPHDDAHHRRDDNVFRYQHDDAGLLYEYGSRGDKSGNGLCDARQGYGDDHYSHDVELCDDHYLYGPEFHGDRYLCGLE